jgi:hypothetical protein
MEAASTLRRKDQIQQIVPKTVFRRKLFKHPFEQNYSNILSNKTIRLFIQTKLFDYFFEQNYSIILSNKTIRTFFRTKIPRAHSTLL